MNGNWEKIYASQGRVQIDVLDTAIEAKNIFKENKFVDILDLGCGTGRHTLMLADNGFNVHACDLSQTGIDITKGLMDDLGLENVTFSLQNMYSLKLESESQDGILCIWVQGHGVLDQVKEGINQAHRVLRKGGIFYTDFVTTDDTTYGIGEQIAPNTFLGGRPGEEEIPHYYTTKEALKELFKAYSDVTIKDKTYRFEDAQGDIHEIKAAVVIAKK